MSPGTWLLIVLTYGVPFLVGPDIYSRLFSGKGRATARRAVLMTAFFMIPMILGIVLAGVLGRAVLGSEASDPDTILLEFASQAVTPLWGGMLMAALLAAVMSSADTCLLTISTLVSRDLLDTLFPRYRNEETLVARSRWIILAAGGASLLVALAYQDIVKALTICYQLYSPAVLCPFLALVIFRGRKFRPITGMLAVGLGAGCAAIGIWADLPDLKLAAFGASALPFVIELFDRRGLAVTPPATKSE
jgi:SSS family solute:Na+ symporter